MLFSKRMIWRLPYHRSADQYKNQENIKVFISEQVLNSRSIVLHLSYLNIIGILYMVRQTAWLEPEHTIQSWQNLVEVVLFHLIA